MNQDKIIVCKDCGSECPFTGGEADFYREKELAEPEYCMICRGKHEARARDLAKYKKK